MHPLASGLRAARFALCLFAALALPGCDRLVGIDALVSSALFRITATSPDLERLTFTISPTELDQQGKTVRPLPAEATLTVGEHGPVSPEQVFGGADSLTVSFLMPREAIKQIHKFSAPSQMDARLLLPVETGVTSYFGTERRTPGRVVATVTLQRRHAGPLTSLGKTAGEFLGGLYKAR